MPRKRLVLAVAGLLSLSLMSAGCGGSGPGKGTSHPSGLVLPPGSTQPFDAIRGDLLKRFDEALRTWDYRCAAAAGFAPVPLSNVREPFHDLKFREEDFGTTDVDVARRDGLLAGGALIDPVREAPNQSISTAEAIGKCDLKARKLIEPSLVSAYDDYAALANDLASQYFARMNSEYQPFRMRLYTCVETKGWHADDVGALSRDADIRKHYQVVTAKVQVNERTGKETYVPTSNEVSLAVAIAVCRKSTGYSRGLFEKSRQIQSAVVGKNEAKLAEANSTLEQAVTGVLGRLA